METEIIIAILAGLGGMLGWGFADFFAKKTIDEAGDVTTLFWAQFFGIFPLLGLFLFNPTIPSVENIELVYLIGLGIWSGLSYIPTYVAFGKGKVSLLSPIFASYAVVVSILSALLLGEVIPFSRQLIFLVVFIGILLINSDLKSVLSHFKGRDKQLVEPIKGLPEITLAVVLYSVWFVALGHFIEGKYWVPILLAIRSVSAISLWIYARFRNINLKIQKKSVWKFLVLIGIFDVAAFSFVSFGFSATRYISIIAMLSGAFSLPTIFLAHIFLKEKAAPLQIIGSLVIIAGIILLLSQ